MYDWIKLAHIGLVVVSVSGFFARGLLMAQGSAWLSRRALRVGPHIVDTALLGSGAWLAAASHQIPFVNSYWLTAKMLALVAYIGFGMIALRHGGNRGVRVAAWLVALACAGYMISTAVSHSPLLVH